MIIVDRFTDLAGKYRVAVQTDSEVLNLKFQGVVSDAEILAEATAVQAAMTAQIELDNLQTISFEL